MIIKVLCHQNDIRSFGMCHLDTVFNFTYIEMHLCKYLSQNDMEELIFPKEKMTQMIVFIEVSDQLSCSKEDRTALDLFQET